MKYKLKDVKSDIDMKSQGLNREQVSALRDGESVQIRNLPPFFKDLVVEEGKTTNVGNKSKAKKEKGDK